MRKIRELKKAIASFTVVAMLFTTSTVSLYADEIKADAEVKTAEETVNESEPVILKDGDVGRLEINQGFSYHVNKDDLSEDPTFIKNFVASKNTCIMYPVEAADEAAAKEATKNWKLYYKKVDSEGNEGDAVLTWEGEKDEFSYLPYYDKKSNTVSGKMMAYVSMSTGPEPGKYNFYLDKDGTNIAFLKDVDFMKTKPLNILAVPVKAYYSKSANVKPEGGGGCPADLVEKSVECTDEYWKNLGDKIGEDGTKGKSAIELIKQYLLDVYPISEVTIDEGNVFDGDSAEYDMCNDDGQKKLWEEVSKLQVRDKETGKDKYDIILAFVMYRQDATGTGQGYTFGKPTNIITLTDPDMLPTVAHEIAHCYGIGDEYDGGSYNYRTNNVPLGYTSKGRDKIDSSTVDNTTTYTFNNVEKYNAENQDKYPWLSSGQFKGKLQETDTVFNGKKKDNVNGDGNGSVIDLELHPFILSKKEFVHFANKGDEVFPTISYMGSGYSGNEYYYFTTSVIWDHLFNEFMDKEKKSETASIFAQEVEDEGLELYYDDEMRFGESKLVEVSGEIQYSGRSETATVSGCIVDPMFSYTGDLEYIDYLDKDGDDKGMKDEDMFVFAALDKNGKVITSPVDGEKSIVEFFASNINTGVNIDPSTLSGDNAVDKRVQDFCEFEFQAEYPEGTAAFAVLNDLDENKSYKEGDEGVLWFTQVPPQDVDGEITAVTNTKDEMKVQWVCGAFDKDDKATTDNLYTMIYYAPKGDDGEVYFMEDGFYEAKDNESGMYDFKVSENGVATYSFKPTDYFEESEITDKAYVWIKVSDGVNGLDLYSDEFKSEEQKKAEEEAKKKAEIEKEVSENKITGKVEGAALEITDLQGATVNYNTQIPSFGKSFKAKEWKNFLGEISISYNNVVYAAKKVKVTKAKSPDAAGFNASVQITDVEGSGADLKAVKKALKKATKADKKNFDNNKIKIRINPLNIEYAAKNGQIDKPVIKGKADKLKVSFKYTSTAKKFTVTNGKNDTFGAPASVTYDATTKAVTFKTGDVEGVLKDGEYESKIK